MSKERTEHSKYQSSFAPPGETIFIRGDQYLAEVMCSRQAAKDKRSLGTKFWNDKEWLKAFRLQLKHAKELLQDFPVGVILKALNHRKAKNVYSLGLKSVLVPLCQDISKSEQVQKSAAPIHLEEVNILETPRKPIAKNNLRNKLRGL
jgi:hypothetical protein